MLIELTQHNGGYEVYINPDMVLGVMNSHDSNAVLVFVAGGTGCEDGLYFSVQGPLEDVLDDLNEKTHQ